MTSNPRTTLDQQRAAYAWECVTGVGDSLPEYTKLAKSAPALIMNNGLMQTLAFLQCKGKDQHKKLLGHLCRWLGRRLGVEPIFVPETEADFGGVMRSLCSAPSSLYRRATDESLDLLRWIRQLAPAHKG